MKNDELAIELIANRCGFKSAEAMRAACRRWMRRVDVPAGGHWIDVPQSFQGAEEPIPVEITIE
jgi:hypothetical protein